MSKFIEIGITCPGDVKAVNVDLIEGIAPNGEGAKLFMSSGAIYQSSVPYSELLKKLDRSMSESGDE